MKYLKKLIKSNKNIYSFFYNMQLIYTSLFMKPLVFIEMIFNYMKIYFNKKVGLKRAHLFHNNIRNRIYKKLILNQIKEFKKNKKEDDVFVLIEVGSLIGASIEIWGNELSKRIKNFTIISIDPFEDYVNQKMKNEYKTLEIRSNFTNKLYTYFIHNNSLLSWRKNIIHIRDYSKNALETLLKLNIRSDFIYIDGAHDYINVKEDLRLSKKLIYNKKKYSGTICGDDYTVNINEHKNFGLSKKEFLSLLNKERQTELITLSAKSNSKFKNITFHPGVTLLFASTKNFIIQLKDGLWKLKL